MGGSDSQLVFSLPVFGRLHLPPLARNELGLPSSVISLFTHAMLFSDPGSSSTTSPWRLFCVGFCTTQLIASYFFNNDGAVSSFTDCGLSYGLRDSLCTLQPLRSALTSPPHGCNTRYEWLVRPSRLGLPPNQRYPASLALEWHVYSCESWDASSLRRSDMLIQRTENFPFFTSASSPPNSMARFNIPLRWIEPIHQNSQL
jgi:hypothetical protein